MNTIVKTTLFSLIGSLAFTACSLDEDPKFPSSEVLFNDAEGANTVLNGAYTAVADFNCKGADFFHLTLLGSGMFTSNKASDVPGIIAGNSLPSLNYVENYWAGTYRVVSRANDVITGMEGVDWGNAAAQDNVLGQAYFLRGSSYFDLVRTYGGVPLLVKPASFDNNNLPRAAVADVYAQIISDLEMAASKLPEPAAQTPGRPAKYAANMLLAKVYMQLAGNDETSPYWQKAWDEAIKVYGQYALVSDYATLWNENTSNITSESIFEVMSNEENTLRLYQLFTASNGNIGLSVWGRIKPNIELYDLHAAKYPGDPRLNATFKTEWTKFDSNGGETLQKTYPAFKNRGNTDKSYPWLNKYYINDIYSANYNTNMNYVALRYADLLLMLAEIENELNGPAKAYQYVNAVLARARQSGAGSATPADWSGMTKEEFRDAIMMEYRYELLGEGHDWYNMKRRGWDYFKANVVDFHNNYAAYKGFTNARDTKFGADLADPSRVMLMPVPSSEITANPNITAADQNPGY